MGEPPTSALTAARTVKRAGSIVNVLRTLRAAGLSVLERDLVGALRLVSGRPAADDVEQGRVGARGDGGIGGLDVERFRGVGQRLGHEVDGMARPILVVVQPPARERRPAVGEDGAQGVGLDHDVARLAVSHLDGRRGHHGRGGEAGGGDRSVPRRRFRGCRPA